MKIKPKEVNRKVNLLTDPNPSFMSLVDNGANQTPWNAVKRDTVTSNKDQHMSKNKAGKGSARSSFLQKMQFSKTQFATKADVKKFLTDNNIEGYDKIEAGDDVWIVKSNEDPSPFKLGKAAATPGLEAGVTAFIAPILSAKDAEDDEDEEDEDEDDDETEEEDEDGDDEDEEEEEEEETSTNSKSKKGAASKVKVVDGKKTRKSVKPKPKKASAEADAVLALPPELASKFDWWGAYTSGESTLSGVLKDGSYDGMPPGLEVVMQAAAFTIGNILTSDEDDSDKAAALKQVGGEMADFAFGLYGLFAKANEDSSKSVNKSVRKAAAQFVDTFSESIASAAKSGTFDNVIDDEDEDEDEDETPAKGKSKKAATPKKTAKSDKSENADDAALERLVGPVTKMLTNIEKRLDGIESRSTSRKSMSDSLEDIIGEEDEDEVDEEAIQRTEDMRRSLGLKVASRSNA